MYSPATSNDCLVQLAIKRVDSRQLHDSVDEPDAHPYHGRWGLLVTSPALAVLRYYTYTCPGEGEAMSEVVIILGTWPYIILSLTKRFPLLPEPIKNAHLGARICKVLVQTLRLARKEVSGMNAEFRRVKVRGQTSAWVLDSCNGLLGCRDR